MEGWSYKTLPDLGELNRGKSKHRPRDASHLYGGDYPFIQTGDVKASGGRITGFTQSYSEEGLAQSRLWPTDTVAITIAANIAETGILTFPACFPDSVVGFIADPKKSNPHFIEYKFRELRKRIQQEHVGTGSVQDNINLAILRTMPFFVPELTEQNSIAAILLSLDDKIELNRRTNETLEALAQAVFKDWFVDFGPVRRKLEGTTDPVAILGGLVRDPVRANDVAAHFPDGFGDSGQPKGWENETLEAVCTVNDESWKASNHPAEVNYVDLSNTKWGVIETTSLLAWKDAPSRAKRIAKPGDTLVGTVRPGNGSFSFISDEGYTASTGFAVLRPKRPEYTNFVYVAATRPENIERLANLADGHGGAYPAVNPGEVAGTEICHPGEPALLSFDQLSGPFRERIEHNKKENRTLAETRDYILPKLMSGDVSVHDAEKMVG